MKKCRICDFAQSDTNSFCTNCGSTEFDPVIEVNKENVLKRKKWYIGFGIGLLLLISALVFIFVIVFNPTNRIMKELEKENYATAKSIYLEKVIGDVGEISKTYEEVYTFTEKLLADYREEEITYDQFIVKLDGINQTGILAYEIEYFYEEAYLLFTYRDIYERAITNMNNQEYEEAIELFSEILNADFEKKDECVVKYEEAIMLYRNEILETVQNYMDIDEYLDAYDFIEEALAIIENDAELIQVQQKCLDEYKNYIIKRATNAIQSEDYSTAFTLIDDAFEYFPNDKELVLLKEECKQLEYDYAIQVIIDKAYANMEKNDYVAALICFDNNKNDYPNDPQLQKERELCVKKYESYTIEESLKYAKKQDYKKAISVAEAGMKYFESNEVEGLILAYESHIPVKLGDMEAFSSDTSGGSLGFNTFEKDEYLVDNYGNEYEHSISVGKGYVTYLVNYKYATLSGTAGFPKGLSSDTYRTSATLLIYGDGEKIAEYKDFDEESKPVPFEINISTYEKVTLEWECDGMNIWGDWGYFATIFEGEFCPVPIEFE